MKSKKLYIAVAAVMMLGFVNCKNSNSNTSKEGTAVETSANIGQSLAPEEFEKKLKATPNAYLIDVRTPEEFADKRIAGAVNMNYNDGGFEVAVQALDNTKPAFIYCLSGGRSSSAVDVFKKMGFKEIYNLDGGLMHWTSQNKPVETGNAVKSAGMNLEEYNKVVASAPVVLVDFNAVWCGPCKKLKPIVESLEKEKLYKLISVDVDENPEISTHFKIESIPLLKLYKNGKEVWTKMGYSGDPAADAAEIKDAIKTKK